MKAYGTHQQDYVTKDKTRECFILANYYDLVAQVKSFSRKS